MNSAVATPATSNGALWTGRVLSGLVIAFLLFDGAIKLVPLQVVHDTMATLGLPSELARTLGVLTLLCTVLYAWPRTAILGAILLTGYLGGAIASHLRIGNPLFSHTLFGVYLGLMAWGGLYLRDPRLQALIPFRR
ncbi:DoxX family protein [Aminobacter sp. LjRoot7]|uniref:DoxX family protein n=1 Tax=Aminobacter sp. LjRoot7 TaxID=3342335 RepID=UPI003ECD87A1